MELLMYTWFFERAAVFCLLCFVIGVFYVCSRNQHDVHFRKNRIMPVISYIKQIVKRNDEGKREVILRIHTGVCKLFESKGLAIVDFGWLKFAHFSKPEIAQIIFNSSTVIDKSWVYRFLYSWLGTGLLTSSKEKWRSRRKLLTPAFHFSILKDFIPVFNQQSAVLVQKLKLLTNKNWIDIVPVITLCTLDIICETAMGIQMNAQSGKYREYVTAIHEISNIFTQRMLKPYLWFDTLFYILPCGRRYLKNLKHVHDFTRQVIKEKREICVSKRGDLCTGSKKRKAFLELLLEHHFEDKSLTEEDIREEVDTLMFAGHDTTSMAISWTLYCLGLYSEIQERVYEELKAIFYDDWERFITYEDLQNMNYLDCVIKESLRLYPPVPTIGRKLNGKLDVLSTTIPSNYSCVPSIYMLHRDEEQYPNAEVFDPDRFLPENSSHRHPFSYVPFSAGPRNCIGQKFALMEVKIVLAHVLRMFRVTSLDQRDKIRMMWGFLLKNMDPLRMEFEVRDQFQ